MSAAPREPRSSHGEGRRAPIADRDPLTWGNAEKRDPSSLTGFVRSAVIVYALMALIGIVWSIATVETPDRTLAGFLDRLVGPRPGVALALGTAAGLLLVAITRLLESWSPIARLVEGFTSILGRVTLTQSIILAAVSSIGEELFFRGAIQPWLGLWATSILFGVLHFPFERRFLAWPFFAAGAGLIFGIIAERTDSLLAPIVAHFVVNAINLHLVGKRARGSRRG